MHCQLPIATQKITSKMRRLKPQSFISQFPWVRNSGFARLGLLLRVFHESAIQVSAGAAVSSEGSAKRRFTSSFPRWLLVEFHSQWAAGLGPQVSRGSCPQFLTGHVSSQGSTQHGIWLPPEPARESMHPRQMPWSIST